MSFTNYFEKCFNVVTFSVLQIFSTIADTEQTLLPHVWHFNQTCDRMNLRPLTDRQRHAYPMHGQSSLGSLRRSTEVQRV